MTDTSEAATIPVTLKWNKQVYSLVIYMGETATQFKQRVEATTGVPVTRQKLMAKKGGWKGTLKDDVILDAASIVISMNSASSSLVVTLIGSAETLAGPTQKTTFIEDLTPAQLRAAEDAQAQEAMGSAEGMIHALQFPPHRRDDQKQEMYQYNRLVTGLPQRQIEQDLKYGQGVSNNQELQGTVAMNLGMELRRAYVNDLAVLEDGTCVSAMDDGHVQLWKHGAQQQDVVHAPGGGEGGVNSIVALRRKKSSPLAFATTGRGVIQFWSADGDPVVSLVGVVPGTTPSSMVSVYGGINEEATSEDDDTITCLATRFQVTRQVNPSQFRLPPQNEEERRRRAQAEAQERAVQETLGKAARSVQVWYSIREQDTSSKSNTTSSQNQPLRYKVLEPPNGREGGAPVTCLASVSIAGKRLLVAGDSEGGLRIWQARRSSGNDDLVIDEYAFFQLAPPSSRCGIVCMEPLRGGRLAVATDFANPNPLLLGATALPIQAPRAVHILDFSDDGTPNIQSTLTGHSKDGVICMCQLPNGDLLTGGGKLDATLQLWSRAQVDGSEKQSENDDAAVYAQPRKVLSEVGYVFALTVLPDVKGNSNYYAVAAGRYNTVKIII